VGKELLNCRSHYNQYLIKVLKSTKGCRIRQRDSTIFRLRRHPTTSVRCTRNTSAGLELHKCKLYLLKNEQWSQGSVGSHRCNTSACLTCVVKEEKGKDISRFHCRVFQIQHGKFRYICDHSPKCKDVNVATFTHYYK